MKHLLTKFSSWLFGRLPQDGAVSSHTVKSPTDDTDYLEVPIIPIANHVILPGTIQLLNVPEVHIQDILHGFSQKKTLVAISFARQLDHKAMLGSQIAVVSEIVEVDRQQEATKGLAAQGRSRATIIDFVQERPLAIAKVKILPDTWEGKHISREDAKTRLLVLLDRWAFLKGNDYPALLDPVRALPPERICDVFGFYGLKDSAQKQQVLELIDGEQRFDVIEKILVTEIDRLEKFPLIHHFPSDHTPIH